METYSEYPLPAAWRGVASPGYLRLARWLSLVEELGGVRGFPSQETGPLSAFLSVPAHAAGKTDMNLLTLSPKQGELEDLRRFVARLHRHERLVLMLFYADGLSLEEIAEVLDLPEATVADIFLRTLATLERHFGEEADRKGRL